MLLGQQHEEMTVKEQHSKEQPVPITVQRFVEWIALCTFGQKSATDLLYFLL